MLTLPVEFSLKQGAGSLKGELDKANKEAERAAADLAKQQAAQVKYLDGVRARYFAEEQRRRDTEVREVARAAAEQTASIERAARQQAAAVASFDAALGGVNAALKGVSSEELRLADLTMRATKLYNQGAISAQQYAAAVQTIDARTKQVKASMAAHASAQASAAQSSGALAAATSNLRSQLIDVYVSLQGGQNPFTVLSQQGPQIAEALTSASGAGAAFASMLGTTATLAGAVAVALGPLLALWYEYAELQKLATERAEAWNRSQDARLPLLERANASLQELKLETSGLNDSEKERAKIIAEWEAELAKANETAKAELEIAQANLDAAKVSHGGYAEKKKLVADLTATIAANNRAAAAGLAADLRLQTMREANAEAARVEAEQTKELAKARKAANKEADRAAKEEQAFVDGVNDEIGKLGDLFDTTGNAIDEANDAVDDTIAALRGVGTAADSSMSRVDKLMGALSGATDIMGMVSSGPEAVLNAVAATGPWGAFIAGLIDFVKNIDESLVSFQSFHMDFMESIASLPQTLVDHLSDTLVESSQAAIRAIPAFIQSLADNIEPLIMAVVEATPTIAVELVNALVRDIPRAGIALTATLLDPRMWMQAGRELFRGLWSEWMAGWQNFASGAWIDMIQSGVEEWWTGLKEGIADWARELVAAIRNTLTGQGDGKAGDVVREVVTLGKAETRYGDTPGLVRAPPGGLLAHFMGGDIIGAARTREGLQKQTGAAPPAPVTVNLADGHRAFDREMTRALAQPAVRAQFFGFTAARRLA